MSNQVYPILDLSKQPIADASETELECNLMQGQSQIQIKKNKYKAYNYFIENYNNEINQISSNSMITLPESQIVKQFKFQDYFGAFLCSIFLLPGPNLLCFFHLIIRLILLLLIYYRIRNNKKKVPDPFKKMVYCPGLSQANAYLKLSQNILLEDLLKLGITSKEYNEAIRRQELEGNFEIIMFYNDRFSDLYSNAGEGLKKTILITIV